MIYGRKCEKKSENICNSYIKGAKGPDFESLRRIFDQAKGLK